jgi:hypothetical protein
MFIIKKHLASVLCALTVAVSSFVIPVFASADVDYGVLGIDGMVYGWFLAINDSGDAAGEVLDDSIRHAVIRKADGTIIDAGTLGIEGMTRGGFNAINNVGDAAGEVSNADMSAWHTVIRKADGTIIDAGTLGIEGMIGGQFNAINNSGDAAGSVFDASYFSHPIIRKADGTIIDAGTLGIEGMIGGQFKAINNSGDAAGSVFNAGYSIHHAVIRKADGTIIDAGTLGIEGMTSGWFVAINDVGDAAGMVANADDSIRHAVIRKADGTIIDLGGFGDQIEIYGMNNKGDLVGEIHDADWSYEHMAIGHVDITAPEISAGSPSGQLTADTTSTTLQITTSESATCKYSTTAGTAYSSMTDDFATADGTTHTANVSGLSNGQSYSYYIRCQDLADSINANTDDYEISFSVAIPVVSEPTPPPATVSNGAPVGLMSGGGSLPRTPSRPQIVYPDGHIVYLDVVASSTNSEQATDATSNGIQASRPPSVSFVFTTNLQLFDTGTNVKMLQQFLNDKGFRVSETGSGSPGNETTLFGAKTWQAVVNFQKSAGIVPSQGYFGPLTRAYMNAHQE